MQISALVPLYNATDCCEKLVKELDFYLKKISKKYEINLIDDGSTDDTLVKIYKLKKKYRKLNVFPLKKNIGQHPAIKYGLKRCKGMKIFILDCDLQDHPKYFSSFFKKFNSKTDVVLGKLDFNSIIRKGIFSFLFWVIFSISRLNFTYLIVGNFILINKKTAKLLIQKTNFLLFDILQLKNIKIKKIKIKKLKSIKKRSGYNFQKLIFLAYKTLLSR